jgi:aspartate/tyrosine/aromatic aminotransferase
LKGLKAEHVKILVEKYHIYLLSSGRISIAGLNDGNVQYVAEAFDQVTRGSSI